MIRYGSIISGKDSEPYTLGPTEDLSYDPDSSAEQEESERDERAALEEENSEEIIPFDIEEIPVTDGSLPPF